jgi:ATP-dependent DNA helicase RecG
VKEGIFVSSVQKELASERHAVAEFIRNDPLLRRFFEVFLFEEIPARDQRADDVYLDELRHSAVYLGIFGNEYGVANERGLSPTAREFQEATTLGRERLIFVKGADDSLRDQRMKDLVTEAGSQLVRRRFATIPDLIASVYASLVARLERTGALRTRPFDAAACRGATVVDISPDKVSDFLARAQHSRGFVLSPDTPLGAALAHLNLLEEDRPTNAAILLFGRQPQRFLVSSEVKCLHFHGTSVQKPIPSYQVYRGTVFELADQALDFVMSKITRSVGTRAEGPAVPVAYELPR